jgi:hypothetical protein
MKRSIVLGVVVSSVLPCLLAPDARAAARRERRPTDTTDPQPTKTFVWTDVEGGVESLHLTTFNADFDRLLVGFAPSDVTGPTVGVGVGLRFVFLTLGVRGRYATFATDTTSPTSGMQLWTLGPELGFRVPLGRVEPYLTFGANYATVSGIGDGVGGLPNGIDVHGLQAKAGFGVDWFVARHISLGGNLSGGVLALTRPGVSLSDLATAQQVGTINEAKARILQANGSSVGADVTGTVGLGVAF